LFRFTHLVSGLEAPLTFAVCGVAVAGGAVPLAATVEAAFAPGGVAVATVAFAGDEVVADGSAELAAWVLVGVAVGATAATGFLAAFFFTNLLRFGKAICLQLPP
jgi:hypothetical protein